MTTRVKKFTKNYNGETIKPGEVMIPFEFTQLDAENCTNAECIKTVKVGGRSFKVIYKAVPEEWAKEGKRALNLIQNEALGHYNIPNSVSMDALKDEYDLELDFTNSAQEVYKERDSLGENIHIFRQKVTLLIEKAPKLGYAVLLISSGSKGADFSEKLRLKHDAANKARQTADKILKGGLMNMDIDSVVCKKNNYTDIYRQEAYVLLNEIIAKL